MAGAARALGALYTLLVIACFLPGSAGAQNVNCEDGSVLHPALPDGFIDGDYAVIGRDPGGESAFQGQARIESDGCAVIMHRRIGGSESTIRGGWQRLDIPEGAYALEFRSGGDSALWSCQIGIDLDNYARLTCFRILTGSPGIAPGLEAFFPTTTWPESMKGKDFR